MNRLTVEEIKALRSAAKSDPRCADEFWFVLMARAIEDRFDANLNDAYAEGRKDEREQLLNDLRDARTKLDAALAKVSP